MKGLEALNIEEVKNEIRLRKDELFSTVNYAGSYFTIKSLANSLFKNEPTKDQIKSVRGAVHDWFEGCKPTKNKANYSKTLCRERLEKIEQEEEEENGEGNGENANDSYSDSYSEEEDRNGLPF